LSHLFLFTLFYLLISLLSIRLFLWYSFLLPDFISLIGMKVLESTFIFWVCYSKNIMCVLYSIIKPDFHSRFQFTGRSWLSWKYYFCLYIRLQTVFLKVPMSACPEVPPKKKKYKEGGWKKQKETQKGIWEELSALFCGTPGSRIF
jgi:hypothetical protein